MPYEVEVKPSVVKALEKLPRPDQHRLLERMQRLSENPRPPGCDKLEGERDAWRIRVGPYRVLYKVDDEIRLVEIYRIGQRGRGVYRRR